VADDHSSSNGTIALLEARHVDNLVESLRNVNAAVRDLTATINRFSQKLEINNQKLDKALPLLEKAARRIKAG